MQEIPQQAPLNAQAGQPSNPGLWPPGIRARNIDEVETQVTPSVASGPRSWSGWEVAPATPILPGVDSGPRSWGGLEVAPNTLILPAAGPGLRPASGRHIWPGQRRLLILAIALLVVVGLGLLCIPLIQRQLAANAGPNAALQHALNPTTTVSTASAPIHAADTFMHAFQQKNWSALWNMLAPDAQALWQGADDFTHFEQTKFGALDLQSYTLGQPVLTSPWLNTHTTQIVNSAVLIHINLQIADSHNTLTARSQQDLSQGLFKNTLLALVQNSSGWQVELAGPADQEAPVLVPVSPPVSHLLIPIYMYHHVSSIPTTNQFDFNLTVTTADFNAQLTWMQKQGYHAITMPELFDYWYDGRALPKKPMILTFDDGYADVYTYALPALLAHHYRGVFYIITGMIGGNYMTWKEVRQLDLSGMEVESHTIHHVNIGEPPAYTSTQSELVKSKSKLESLLKKPIQFFCYPTGEPFHHDTVAEQQLVLKDLLLDGYLGATLDPAEYNSALQNSRLPYQMPRIRVSGGETLSVFEGILTATLQADQQRLQALS